MDMKCLSLCIRGILSLEKPASKGPINALRMMTAFGGRKIHQWERLLILGLKSMIISEPANPHRKRALSF